MGYGQGGGNMQSAQGQQYNPNQGPQQWYAQQQQQQQQQGYYQQQIPNGKIIINLLLLLHFCKYLMYFLVSRFERPQINQSKQALSNMLRQRHPVNQFISGPGGGPGSSMGGGGPQPGPGGYQPMQRQFPRQPLRQQHPAAMQGNQVFHQFVKCKTSNKQKS